jgi:hypothetical protein
MDAKRRRSDTATRRGTEHLACRSGSVNRFAHSMKLRTITRDRCFELIWVRA